MINFSLRFVIDIFQYGHPILFEKGYGKEPTCGVSVGVIMFLLLLLLLLLLLCDMVLLLCGGALCVVTGRGAGKPGGVEQVVREGPGTHARHAHLGSQGAYFGL
jgi:hypothetical protein